ncbi:MAG: phenylalanine--tRNA ligase subunit alpha [Bacteroidota bacterium]|nr:phenylalanine--tRNA ligase subunit alpha [Candidatus Kapabacteria bacterium]MDW8220015.1 phenylalanine--tRNA ligase subunit alpha [Bacteroidota bacterium]
MLHDIIALRKTIEQDIEALGSLPTREELERFRLKHLVRKGTLAELTERLRSVPKEEKPTVGKELNALKSFAETEFKRLSAIHASHTTPTATLDLTLPGRPWLYAPKHPIRQTLDDMLAIFQRMGFAIAEGPEIEDDKHNFEDLNFPPDHPARDMQDTFFVEVTTPDGIKRHDVLLRTHTSPVQIRLMKAQAPPIRAVIPGRVYRNEAISARSLAEFHQIEGLYIDNDVSFSELKGTLVSFAQQFYGPMLGGAALQYRFRPSFFPFTEPSAEMDITCFLCTGKGCRICKYSGWLEILGCGMVHPNVLRAGGIDPEEYSGFAWGMGIERVTLLRTGIDDIRLLYENDVRVLEQFV